MGWNERGEGSQALCILGRIKQETGEGAPPREQEEEMVLLQREHLKGNWVSKNRSMFPSVSHLLKAQV